MSVDWPNIDNQGLMLWVMHAFATRFKHHAILKGGMQLMLLSSARQTNDLDYVFVPYRSKNEIAPDIEKLLSDIPGARIEKNMHSNMGSYRIRAGQADVQVEFNVASAVASVELTTELLAHKLNRLPKIIRVMSPDAALAHKLAAWNERRLLRDLYDAYYLHTHVGAAPDIDILKQRLKQVDSRLPKLKKIKQMTLVEFTQQLQEALDGLTEEALKTGLAPVLSSDRLKGLLPVLKTRLNELVSSLKH